MEALAWFLVIVGIVLYMEIKSMGAPKSGTSYLIYAYRWNGIELIQDKRPIDGVFASNSEAAIEIAQTRNNYKRHDSFLATACYTVNDRLLAVDLDGRHLEPWWSVAEFVEYMQEQEKESV